MNRKILPACVAAGMLVVTGLAAGSAAAHPRQVIIEWNRLAQQNIVGQPFFQTRAYAMVNVAMADAVVAIEGQYEPFHVRLKGVSMAASAEAAAAQAAHDVLVALFPANQVAFDTELRKSLANMSPETRSGGRQVGREVARIVLKWRQSDGFIDANPQPSAFIGSLLPGIWRQTISGPAQYTELAGVEPFGLLTSTQFLPVPPPQLESGAYADDYNDVREKGRATGSTRTLEETRFAQLFALAPGPYANVTTPFILWQNVAADLARTERLSLVRTARLFALLTVAIHDGLQTSHTSKFIYRLWRPETAIAQAAIDDNAGTVAESGWMPLLATPPYPSHSSNMSCIGASAAQTLANVFQTDAKSFTAKWYTGTTPPAVVHEQPYESFWALAQDQGSSRVWGGIHFRFEIDASEESCPQVANYVFDNYMRPRSR